MNKWKDDNCRNCLTCGFKSPMFNKLSTKELHLINENKFEVSFRKGEIIRKQGTFMSHVISINLGLAKLYIEGYHGRNLILRIIKATNFIGGPGMYYDHRHHYSVMAMMDMTACFIDMKVFKSVIHSNPDFAGEFMKEFSKNMLLTYERLISLSQKNTPGRMAEALLYLAQEIFENNRFDPSLTRTDLAELTGMSKDSAIRILRDFSKDKLITINKEVELINIPALMKISEFG